MTLVVLRELAVSCLLGNSNLQPRCELLCRDPLAVIQEDFPLQGLEKEVQEDGVLVAGVQLELLSHTTRSEDLHGFLLHVFHQGVHVVRFRVEVVIRWPNFEESVC